MRAAGKTTRLATGKEDSRYTKEAAAILKSQMKLYDYTFKGLAAVLNPSRDPAGENARSLTNKANRGTFSFAFFLRAMRTMGADALNVPLLKQRKPKA